jgi:3-oxo-5-alpha-steroid 4-dehydrogenase 1
MNKIFSILLLVQFLSSFLVFFILLFISAPYGKHFRKGWGICLKSWQGWLLMEIPAFLVILIMFLWNYQTITWQKIIFLLIWESHYIYRAFIYPFLLRGSKKTFPVMLILFAVIFNSINGYINGYYLFGSGASFNSNWFISIPFILGTLLFYTGFVIHAHSDRLIRKLRNNGDPGYKMPFGGMFRFVSSPNYLGEIIEWTGWAMLTWSMPGLAFAVFTFANLFPRALSNHKWYKQEFKDYPAKRKAIVPNLI